MKDLYTFDSSVSSALSTYSSVREIYSSIFRQLNIPVLVAEASSGSIGGDLSHEYHLESSYGEDTLHVCSGCSFTANEEVLPSHRTNHSCPKCNAEMKSVKSIELGHTFHLGTKYSAPLNATITPPSSSSATEGKARVPIQMGCHGIGISRIISAVTLSMADQKGLNWTRRIAPFEVIVMSSDAGVPLADVESVYDVITQSGVSENDQKQWNSEVKRSSNETMLVDAVMDDRSKSLGWKLNDADVIGYPIIVVLGREWKSGRKVVEVQCRRLKVKEGVAVENLAGTVRQLLGQL